ncbi:MAG: S-layer homology domain-containing protein [Tissierellia bacterium]|nr:S-layer homology domain-containing protein [Tissierellia bacterium]
MKRKDIIVILTFLWIFFYSTSSMAKDFTDTQGHWAEPYILKLKNEKILNGYEDNTFRPNNPISRVEFYTMVNKFVGLEKTYTVTFTDVDPRDWFYYEVAKGIKAGYLIPTTGKLNPNVEMTREEGLEILEYFYDFPKNKKKDYPFEDWKEVSSSRHKAVGSFIDIGILKGDGKYLKPKDPITRGEISKILYLLLESQGRPKVKSIVDSNIIFGT